jgi:predicted nuclease of predicted toxin-antitoxin system
VRFFLDEDLSDEAARIARNLGLDAHSVHEVGRRGLSDAEQFNYAIAEEMVMVTCNRDDYLALNNLHVETGRANCGLLIVSRSLPHDQAARIAHRLNEWAAEKASAPESFGSYVVDFL